MQAKRKLLPVLILAFLCAFFVNSGYADEIRTWSDATGRFKIEAKLISQKDGKVKLERIDGKSVEIDIAKLSDEDQKFLKELEANPFKVTGNDKPSMTPKKGGTPTGNVSPSGTAPIQSTGEVDWDRSRLIDISTYGDGWELTPIPAEELSYTPKTVSLPRRVDFFEKLQGMAINAEAGVAVGGYIWNFGLKNKAPQTRLVQCNLKTGRVSGESVVLTQMKPLAVHPDGELILMTSTERNKPEIEVWKMERDNVSRMQSFNPTQESRFGSKSISFAGFINAESFIVKDSTGLVSIWDLKTLQPQCHFNIEGGCQPALSADGTTLAFYHKERIGLFDTEAHEVIAIQKAPRRLSFPKMAISPSGERIACVTLNEVIVWNLSTGEVFRDFSPSGLHINTQPYFVNDDFMLLGNRYLVELENMIKLWDYHGADSVQSIGGTTYFSVSPQNAPGALMPTLIPHDAAREALNAALNEPDLFVFREGATVRLDTTGIPGNHKAEVEGKLRNKLDSMNVTVDNSAPVTLKASVSGPKQEQMSYTRSGTYTVQKYTTSVALLYEGKSIWSSSGTNIPHFVRIKSNENLGDILREKSKQADYSFFKNLTLPKFVQKPIGDGKAGASSSGQTIGSSQVVPTGSSRRRPTGGRRR